MQRPGIILFISSTSLYQEKKEYFTMPAPCTELHVGFPQRPDAGAASVMGDRCGSLDRPIEPLSVPSERTYGETRPAWRHRTVPYATLSLSTIYRGRMGQVAGSKTRDRRPSALQSLADGSLSSVAINGHRARVHLSAAAGKLVLCSRA